MNDFKEMHPTESKDVGGMFSPLLDQGVTIPDDFEESYLNTSDGENDRPLKPVVIDQDNVELRQQEQNIEDGDSGLELSTSEEEIDDLHEAWDSGYAAGVTESGELEAQKYAGRVAALRAEYKEALDSIILKTDDIVLSENLISFLKKYCEEISFKIFGDNINGDLKAFILEKIEQFSREIKSNEPTVSVTVSQDNFDKLECLGLQKSGNGLVLTKTCTVYSSVNVDDNDFCRAVADIDGTTIKADLNLGVVKQEIQTVTDEAFAKHEDIKETDVMQSGSTSKVIAKKAKSAIMAIMENSLEGINLDGISGLDGGLN